MEIKTLTKGPEQIFGVFKNGEAVFINSGTPVCVDYTTAANGISVILPTTAMLYTFTGIIKEGEYLGTSGQPDELGLVQLYGHHGGIYVAGTTVTPGAMMVPADGSSAVTLGVTLNDANSAVLDTIYVGGYVVCGTTACLDATSTFLTSNTMKGFVKAL